MFCKDHWYSLCREMDDWHGLKHLDPLGDLREVAGCKFTAQIPHDYDPLLSAHDIITTMAILELGPYVAINDCCPICELQNHREKWQANQWLEGGCNCVHSYQSHEGKLLTVQ